MVKPGYFLILSILLSALCCKGDRSSYDKQVKFEEDTSRYAQLESKVKEVYYRFPSPDEMFAIIDSTGLQFDNTLLLPIENASKYLDSKSQALNLGVYIADLAYITLFQRYKESVDYLQVIHLLSEKIRIASAFEEDLVDRIEKNIRNIDSLRAISDNALTSLINYLVRNDKENTFAIISIGGMIEFYYLALNLAGNYKPEDQNIQHIVDQKMAFDNLMKYSYEFSDDSNLTGSLEIVEPLSDFLNSITVVRVKTTVTKTEDGRIIVGGGDKLKITEEEYNEFKRLVGQIRKKIMEIP